MTKFMNPSFSSPANNSNYSDNYDRIFGRKCSSPECEDKAHSSYNMCLTHLTEAGIEVEKPETD